MSVRVLDFARRHLPFRDVALALVLAAFAALDVLLSPDWRGPVLINVVAVPAMALSLAWRRGRPLAVLAVVVGVLSLLSLAFGGSQTWSNVFILIVAVYSAAAHGSQPLVAAVLAAVGVAVHDLRDPAIQGFGDALWSSTLLGLTFAGGLAGRAARLRTSALQDRAETLEREEAEVAAAAVSEERGRIARELHDILSHSLGTLVLQAGAAEQVLQRDPERARQVLKSIRTSGQEAIGEMGAMLALVQGQPVCSREPPPCLADVGKLIAKSQEAGMAIDLEISGDVRPLPTAVELSAFRVVQEGLTNSLKHAGPARVRVLLRYGAHSLDVEVVDDGAGGQIGQGGRRGLAGLRARVAVFGGDFEAGPGPTGGWRLRAAFELVR